MFYLLLTTLIHEICFRILIGIGTMLATNSMYRAGVGS